MSNLLSDPSLPPKQAGRSVPEMSYRSPRIHRIYSPCWFIKVRNVEPLSRSVSAFQAHAAVPTASEPSAWIRSAALIPVSLL